MSPKSDPASVNEEPLGLISERTIGHYERSAQRFWEATRDHDVSENRKALLRHLPSRSKLRILDLGCGPGRDLIAFRDLGHDPVGLDGCPRFCAMARDHSGCEVLEQDLLALDLPVAAFDGIFANASLFHVPTRELPRVLGQLHSALVPGGALFSSNPRGDNREGWQGERYGAYHDLTAWRALLTANGFAEREHYYRPPGKPRSMQPWLATVFARAERT